MNKQQFYVTTAIWSNIQTELGTGRNLGITLRLGAR